MQKLPIFLILTLIWPLPSWSLTNRCDLPAIGESFVVNSDAGIGSHYTLERNDDKAFTLYVNLKLKGDSTTRQRIEKCLSDVNKFGIGDGKTFISLKLFDSARDRVPAPPTWKVKVRESQARANSKTYDNDDWCGTYVHEMLHVVGLIDEYEEMSITMKNGRFEPNGSTSEKKAFDCRSKSESVMGLPGNFDGYWTQGQKVYGNSNAGKIVCGCHQSAAESSCQKESDRLVELSMQQPLKNCRSMTVLGGNPNTVQAPTGHKLEEYASVVLDRWVPQSFPLRAAHVRKMIYPYCPERNSLYESCVANAYRTSVEHGGEGCLSAPAACRQLDEWLN